MTESRGLKWVRRPWPDEPVIEFDSVYCGCSVAVWYRNRQWHWLAEGPSALPAARTGEALTLAEAKNAAIAAVNQALAAASLQSPVD